MSTYKKKCFKKVSKAKDGTKLNPSKRELKFAPVDPKGFATQATYQQVKDALLIAIDSAIDDDRPVLKMKFTNNQPFWSKLGLQVLTLKRLRSPRRPTSFYMIFNLRNMIIQLIT